MHRRQFLKGGAAGVAASSISTSRALGASHQPLEIEASSYLLDRTEALFDGRVQIEGAKASFFADTIGEMNTAMFSGSGTRAISEVGLHPYILAYANEGFRDYALLPIPLLRQFRHKSIFVRADAGIGSPQGLRGRRVGTAGYSSTSLTWIRGILNDEYSVAPTDVTWVISNEDSSAGEAGATSAQEMVLPDGLTVEKGIPGLDESELLLRGEVDALFHAATPAAFLEGDPRVIRLFEDVRAVEQDYFERTGVFPIMHVLSIKRKVADEHPSLAAAVFKAYSEAKLLAYREMDRLRWATDMLPWYGAELEDTRRFMGRNFYPYGFEANRKTFETLFEYSYEQGLASRVLTAEEVFLPGSLDYTE